MPDVDWEKVAADVADLPDNPTLFVEWWAFADHLPELVAAIRWGLEAQQRGERVLWCDTHNMHVRWDDAVSCTLGWRDVIDCRISERILARIKREAPDA